MALLTAALQDRRDVLCERDVAHSASPGSPAGRDCARQGSGWPQGPGSPEPARWIGRRFPHRPRAEAPRILMVRTHRTLPQKARKTRQRSRYAYCCTSECNEDVPRPAQVVPVPRDRGRSIPPAIVVARGPGSLPPPGPDPIQRHRIRGSCRTTRPPGQVSLASSALAGAPSFEPGSSTPGISVGAEKSARRCSVGPALARKRRRRLAQTRSPGRQPHRVETTGRGRSDVRHRKIR